MRDGLAKASCMSEVREWRQVMAVLGVDVGGSRSVYSYAMSARMAGDAELADSLDGVILRNPVYYHYFPSPRWDFRLSIMGVAV